MFSRIRRTIRILTGADHMTFTVKEIRAAVEGYRSDKDCGDDELMAALTRIDDHPDIASLFALAALAGRDGVAVVFAAGIQVGRRLQAARELEAAR